jgi:hypothetical protein
MACCFYSLSDVPDSNRAPKGLFKVLPFVLRRKLSIFFEIKCSPLKIGMNNRGNKLLKQAFAVAKSGLI